MKNTKEYKKRYYERHKSGILSAAKRWRTKNANQHRRILDAWRQTHLREHALYARRSRYRRDRRRGKRQLYTADFYRISSLRPRQSDGRFYVGGRPLARINLEKKLGRPLADQEVVHHINGDPGDDQPENLYLFNQATSHDQYEANQRSAWLKLLNDQTLDRKWRTRVIKEKFTR